MIARGTPSRQATFLMCTVAVMVAMLSLHVSAHEITEDGICSDLAGLIRRIVADDSSCDTDADCARAAEPSASAPRAVAAGAHTAAYTATWDSRRVAVKVPLDLLPAAQADATRRANVGSTDAELMRRFVDKMKASGADVSMYDLDGDGSVSEEEAMAMLPAFSGRGDKEQRRPSRRRRATNVDWHTELRDGTLAERLGSCLGGRVIIDEWVEPLQAVMRRGLESSSWTVRARLFLSAFDLALKLATREQPVAICDLSAGNIGVAAASGEMRVLDAEALVLHDRVASTMGTCDPNARTWMCSQSSSCRSTCLSTGVCAPLAPMNNVQQLCKKLANPFEAYGASETGTASDMLENVPADVHVEGISGQAGERRPLQFEVKRLLHQCVDESFAHRSVAAIRKWRGDMERAIVSAEQHGLSEDAEL